MAQEQAPPERDIRTAAPPPTPRWVRIVGLLALVLLLALLALHLTGHAPMHHAG